MNGMEGVLGPSVNNVTLPLTETGRMGIGGVGPEKLRPENYIL